jgi:hypothetical protein
MVLFLVARFLQYPYLSCISRLVQIDQPLSQINNDCFFFLSLPLPLTSLTLNLRPVLHF